MPSSNTKFIISIVVDIVIFLIVALTALLLDKLGKPYKRGFFCNDVNIRYPYKSSTVSTALLLVIFTLIPFLSIGIIEYLHVRECYCLQTHKKKFKKWLWSLYQYLKIFLFGFATSVLIVNVFKFSLGTLRPHFIDICDPDWQKINCTLPENFITGTVCTPNSEEEIYMIKEARLSFMSGHACIASYSMFFLIFYMQYRLIIKHYSLIKPFIQLIWFILIILISASRVSDYHHHWSDIFAGIITGLIIAGICVFVILKLRKRKQINIKVCRSDSRQVCTEKSK